MAVLLLAFRGGRGDAGFTLEVPATYLSVGQQIQPRLLATGAAAPVTLTLLDAAGRTLQRQTVDPGRATAAAVAMPAPGRYILRASDTGVTHAVTLRARPEPAPDFGGVMAVTSLGLAPGAADYLRQHGFAITAGAGLAAARSIVVGSPGLGVAPAALGDTYAALWRRVGQGAHALLLQPPTPALAPYWPVAPPLVAVHACDRELRDPSLLAGLPADAGAATLLAPSLAFDLSHQSQFDFYHWNGTWLDRPNHASGYPGCHALFSFRYGNGWVTLTTAPLLEHFQDLRARVVLMNLVAGLARRRPTVPPSPGLEWVHQQRLKKLARQPLPPRLEDEVFYQPPPAVTAPAPVEAPIGAAANPCWTSPAPQAPGATLRLDLGPPRSVTQVELNFGADAQLWPTAAAAAASIDGLHWVALPPLAPQSGGGVTLPLPAAPTGWRAIRLTLTSSAPQRHWRVCQFTAR